MGNRRQAFVDFFAKKIGRKRLLTFLFFLLLSTILWYFQRFKEEEEKEFSVSVELVNVPDEVVVTTEPPRYIYLTLRDQVGRLVRYDNFISGPLKISFDFTRYAESNAGYYGRIPLADIKKAIAEKISPSSQVVSLRPDTIEFYYNYGDSRRLPVHFSGSFDEAQGYAPPQLHLLPDTVTVYAPDGVLDTLTEALLRPIYLTGVKDTVRQSLAFVRIPGVKFEPSRVELILTSDRLVEKIVQDVPIRTRNFPKDKVLRLFPGTVDVICQVGMSAYGDIAAGDFDVVVDYADFLQARGSTLPLHLEEAPAGVSYPRLKLQEVEYVIEDSQ